jgi:hypothetical protein
MEVKVIAPWRDLAKAVSDAMKGRMEASRQKKCEDYMRLQQESFEDLQAAVRQDDKQRYAQFLEKSAAAQKIAAELNGKNEQDR